MDAAGNVMPWVRDQNNAFTWTMSWEKHDKNLKVTSWPNMFPATPDGYYAIGVRCAY